jgi:hypothetical protein
MIKLDLMKWFLINKTYLTINYHLIIIVTKIVKRNNFQKQSEISYEY